MPLLRIRACESGTWGSTTSMPFTVFALKITSLEWYWGEYHLKNRHDGLYEYISRAARVELASLLVKRFGSLRLLAVELGVTHISVVRWLRPDAAHPSNKNLQKIVSLAADLDCPKTSKILMDDFRKHEALLKEFDLRPTSRASRARARDAPASPALGLLKRPQLFRSRMSPRGA